MIYHSIDIKIEVLFEEDFTKERVYKEFGSNYTRVDTIMPIINKRKVWCAPRQEDNEIK
jgi:hypothetical protein